METRLEGGFDLLCAPDARGESVLREQFFRAPIHLSKPHRDAGALVVNVVTPTAGLFAGDRVRLRAEVAGGARLVLTTPAATRVHAMRGAEGWAETQQEFVVRAGGSLEWWPEPLIPQGGARHHQRTTLTVEAGGELLFLETVAPGRVAAGEAFAFEELRWATDLRCGERLVARERFWLTPDGPGLAGLRRRFPRGYWGSVFVVAPGLADRASRDWEEALRAGHDEGKGCWLGVSASGAPGAFVLKLVTADSLGLRRLVGALRKQVYAALDRSPPDLRRVG